MSESSSATKTKAAPAKAEGGEDQPVTATGISEVKYTGAAGVREVTAAQWKGAGIENQATVTWDASNDYTLPGTDFTDAAVEILRKDKNFKIS